MTTPDHYYVRLTGDELEFILDYTPEQTANYGANHVADLRRWMNTVKDLVQDNLEEW